MADKQFDVVVIGAGPAGYVAAIRCAQLGLHVACVDEWQGREGKSSLGGTCLNVGCIPSKALLQSSRMYHEARNAFEEHGIKTSVTLDLPRMQARKNKVVEELTNGVSALLKANKVEVIHGHARLSPGKIVNVLRRGGKKVIATCEADHIILATGSSPMRLEQAPLTDDYILDSSGALELDKVPKTLGIVGAGAIGLELGSVWSRLGSEVVLMEAMDTFMPMVDSQVARQAMRSFRNQGLDIRLGARLLSSEIKQRKVHVTYEDTRGAQQVKFDKLVVAVGRKPNTDLMFDEDMELELDERGYIHVNRYCETSVPGVYAIGDIVRGPMLAHKGSEEGIMVAERIAGENSFVDYDRVPSVIYTHPEIAWVGMTEQTCESEGIPVRKGSFPMTASGRAKASGFTEGMIKILAHADTDRIVGVHIMAAEASELIAQAVIAMAMEANAEDLALTMFAHPTLSESLHEAAFSVHGRAIHARN